MMAGTGAGSHWARSDNKQGANTFIKARKQEADRRDAQRQREREFFADVRRRVRSLFRRS